MITQADLRHGDHLLYSPAGIFGYLIVAKTWHAVSHVECYLGNGTSAASRDGIGVGRYPLRLSQLAYVLRPRGYFDLTNAQAFVNEWAGTPYGWLELLNFYGLPVKTVAKKLRVSPRAPGRGIVCSPFVTRLDRAAWHNIFPTDDPDAIAPFEFLLLAGECFDLVWSKKAGFAVMAV